MKHLTVEQTPENIVVITIDSPKTRVNKVSSDFLNEIDALMDELINNRDIKGLVIVSGKKDNFIVGADIDELKSKETPEEVEAYIGRGNEFLNKFEKMPFPIVSVIHGNCLGGGLEFILVCDYRIATKSTKTVMGLPEVKLGVLPAAGGTQRLPRLIGLKNALPLMLQGSNIRPKKAKRLGLIDETVPPYGLKEIGIKKALSLKGKKKVKRKRKKGLVDWFLESPFGRGIVFSQARKMVMRQTHGLYPAPLAIIDSVEYGYKKGVKKGIEADCKRLGQLATGPEAKSLMGLFNAMTELKKNPLQGKARKVEKLAVLGAGLMGNGIASVSLPVCDTVLLKDVDLDAVARGMKPIRKSLDRRARSGALTSFEREILYGKLVPCDDYSSFASTDLVVEAVFEDLDLKKKILADVEKATGDTTIFASNTSALPIADIAKGCKRPGNVIGMHYFSPVPAMPLLEIIRTKKTADWVVATAVEFGIKQGKTCIVVKDGPGFYTTRILAPLLNEAGLLVEEGAGIREIDRAMQLFGYPVGPIALLDEVGIDVGVHVSESLSPLFESRGGNTSESLPILFDKGYKGKKNKKGFYRYDVKKKGGARQPDENVYKLLGIAERKEMDVEEIQHRVSLMMVNEAAYCLQEGVISSPRDGDVGAILGLGFPPFRGGPFRYADAVGVQNLVDLMNGYADVSGPRFAPAKILADMARKKKRFYP